MAIMFKRAVFVYDTETKKPVAVEVTIKIDGERLAKLMGTKANRNDTKRSTLMGEALIATIKRI